MLIKYLKIVKKLYKRKKLIYFKHRKEHPLKLEKIKEIGFNIKNIETTYENYFESKSLQSGIICSFYTTSVIMNISKNFINTPELIIYTFPINKLTKERKIFNSIIDAIKEDENIKIVKI